MSAAEEILERTAHDELQRIYSLPNFTSTLEFLTMLALSSGRLHKGGTPDLLAAARTLLADWNAQKIPYYTNPPVVHPSSVPSAVAGGGIAPGAEDVGQARIVEGGMSAPFSLAGLFGDADEGAFGDAEMADEAEAAAASEKTMGEAALAMEEDGPTLNIPRKRHRSMSPTPSISLSQPGDASLPQKLVAPFVLGDERAQRQPKRLRKNKDTRLEAHALAAMGSVRRKQKMDRKKARKAARGMERMSAGGMEVDEGLEGTFMAA